MKKIFKKMKIDFPSPEQYFCYCILDGYKQMLYFTPKSSRKKLKRSHFSLYIGRYVQLFGCLFPVPFYIHVFRVGGIKTLLESTIPEAKLALFVLAFGIAMMSLGMIPIITYKKRLKEIMPKAAPSSVIEDIDPPKSISFMENGLELTTANIDSAFILYTSFKAIGIYRRVIAFALENNKENAGDLIGFLLPKEMFKNQDDWKILKQFLAGLDNSTTHLIKY